MKNRRASNKKINKQNLINKISDAMRMKYNNFFTAANYDEKTLKTDITNFMNTQYCFKEPKDVFKPIETHILTLVKKNNPQLQPKVKKARKLPEIKYTFDKYQEADEAQHVKKEKEKQESKQNKAKSNKNN